MACLLPEVVVLLYSSYTCKHVPVRKSRIFSTTVFSFLGSRNTAEVVFLLDCSATTGVLGFHNLIRFVKELIHVMDIAPDRTRVGVIPYNESVFSSCSISTYYNKRELLEAICTIQLLFNIECILLFKPKYNVCSKSFLDYCRVNVTFANHYILVCFTDLEFIQNLPELLKIYYTEAKWSYCYYEILVCEIVKWLPGRTRWFFSRQSGFSTV